MKSRWVSSDRPETHITVRKHGDVNLWLNMGPLRIEFTFLSLYFSQDVTLPYATVSGVSRTICELCGDNGTF